MPEISVIVPVYNVEDYLRCCVDSILSQSFSDFELILVDDGSNDRSGQICEEYTVSDTRIKVFHQKNKGQSAARNRAICEASGDYVCFVDADDFLHPKALECLFKLVKCGTNCIASCGVEEGEFNTQPQHQLVNVEEFKGIWHSTDEVGIKELIKDPYICWIICCKLIPIDIVRKHLLKEGRYYEDNAIILKWLKESDRLIHSEERLYYYRINTNGTTKGRWTIKKERDLLWSEEERLSFYAENGMASLFETYYSSFLRKAAKSIYTYRRKYPAFSFEMKKRLRWWWKTYSVLSTLTVGEKQYLFGAIYPIREMITEWWTVHGRKKSDT